MNAKAKTPRITLYTTGRCPHCRRLKAFLQQRGLTFRELDVERSRRALTEFQRLGGRSVPLVQIGDAVVRGFDRRRLEQLLKGG